MASDFFERFFSSLGRAAPKRILASIDDLLNYAGLKSNAGEWLGYAMLISFVFSLAALSAALEFRKGWLVAFIAAIITFLICLLILYILLYFRSEDRKNRVEKVLPDALTLVSSNIRAGLNPIAALRMAARPEFGPLEEEIKYATAKSLGTESLSNAMLEITKTIRSELLKRTVSLFVTSVRSGGNIARLLENSAEDIRNTQELKQQLLAGTNMYALFILFTIIIGMPALFSVSLEFVGMVSKFQLAPQSHFAAQLGISSMSPISSQFVFNLSLATLVLTAILASALMGVIHEGKKLHGLKWAPFLVTASLTFFFIMREYLLKFLLKLVL